MGYVAIWRESRTSHSFFATTFLFKFCRILSRRHVMVGNTLVGTKILQTLCQDVAGRHCRVANDRSSPAASWWTWFSTRNRVVITPVCLFVCVCPIWLLIVVWGSFLFGSRTSRRVKRNRACWNNAISIPIPSGKIIRQRTHRIHGVGIYANIWGILMVNVTVYSIHGSYGICHSFPV